MNYKDPKTFLEDYYVAVKFKKENRQIDIKSLDNLIEENLHLFIGHGDPKMGMPKNESARKFDQCYNFSGAHNATEFARKILKTNIIDEIEVSKVNH